MILSAPLRMLREQLHEELLLIFINFLIPDRHLKSLILPLSHRCKGVTDVVCFLFKLLDLLNDSTFLVVLVSDSLLVLIFASFIFVLGLAADLYFADSIRGNIDVIDSVLEFGGHLVSVLVERLLQGVLVVSGDFNFEKLSLRVFHDPVEVFSPHPKAFNMVDWLVQKL